MWAKENSESSDFPNLPGNPDFPTFKEIQPFSQDQFKQALTRLQKSPMGPVILKTLYPHRDFKEWIQKLSQIQDVQTFQAEVISEAVNTILKLTSKGMTISGLSNHSSEEKYLYISNHRDIICDPAFLTNGLYLNGYGTPKICLGDNLLVHPLLADLVKMNKGITVKRNLTPRELLKFSISLSSYIYLQIIQKTDSVWIAQREGRAKDGNDKTQPGILKMLTMAGEGDFTQRIRALNIIPVSISYELDPCDALKARELFLRELNGGYQKKSDEDVFSIRKGIEGQKGRIHISLGTPLNQLLNPDNHLLTKREQVNAVALLLEREIQKNYKNWPTNYIAFDWVHQCQRMSAHYDSTEKSAFLERMESQIHSLDIKDKTHPLLRQIFLRSYANSVIDPAQPLDSKLANFY